MWSEIVTIGKSAIKSALWMTIFLCVIATIFIIIVKCFHDPLTYYLHEAKSFFIDENVEEISKKEQALLAKMMAKGFVMSGSDLMNRIGSYYSYTITLLIFFCTFSCVVAVFLIKSNMEDRFDQTIKDKVNYYFANDRGFSDEFSRTANALATLAVRDELEQMDIERDLKTLEDKIEDKITASKDELERKLILIQNAISENAPQDDIEDGVNVEDIVNAQLKHADDGR